MINRRIHLSLIDFGIYDSATFSFEIKRDKQVNKSHKLEAFISLLHIYKKREKMNPLGKNMFTLQERRRIIEKAFETETPIDCIQRIIRVLDEDTDLSVAQIKDMLDDDPEEIELTIKFLCGWGMIETNELNCVRLKST